MRLAVPDSTCALSVSILCLPTKTTGASFFFPILRNAIANRWLMLRPMTASGTRSMSNTEEPKPYSSHDCPAFQRVRPAGPAQMNRRGRKWPRQRRNGRYSQSRDPLDAEDTLHAHLQKGEDPGSDRTSPASVIPTADFAKITARTGA